MRQESTEMEYELNDGAETRQSRRRLLTRAVGGAGVLTLAGTGALTFRQAIAKDDDDDDNSGHGSGGDDHDNSGHGGGGDDDEPVITGEIPPSSIEIRIVDDDANGFSPGSLTIDVGQSVTFVNADHHAHTATGAGFDTGVIQPGGTATVALDQPGTFYYACQIHPEMTGSIGVRGPDGSPMPNDVATPRASPAAEPDAAGGVLVSIVDFSFEPATQEIPAGTMVTWRNDDATPHTATAEGGSFDTGQLDPGQEGSHTFDQPGTYDYACAFHPQMVGAVVVTEEALGKG